MGSMEAPQAFEIVDSQAVIELLQRRPCTSEDVARGLGIHRQLALKTLEALRQNGRVSTAWVNDCIMYKAPTAKGNTV